MGRYIRDDSLFQVAVPCHPVSVADGSAETGNPLPLHSSGQAVAMTGAQGL